MVEVVRLAVPGRDRRYTNTHEWVMVDQRDPEVAVVGVSDYAQSSLGDVVYVAEVLVGHRVAKDEAVGSIDSVKVSAELYSPLNGEIVAFNKLLVDSPELINSDPYGESWIFKIKMADRSELDSLMTEDDYKDTIS